MAPSVVRVALLVVDGQVTDLQDRVVDTSSECDGMNHLITVRITKVTRASQIMTVMAAPNWMGDLPGVPVERHP